MSAGAEGAEASREKPAGVYPGPRSILRYLRIEQQNREDGSAWARLPALPDLMDAGGAVRMGAVAPMCDLIAGSLASVAVDPDWVATSDFKLHLLKPVTGGSIEALCRPLRIGKNMVLSESRLTDESGELVALSLVTFNRLPRRDGQPPNMAQKTGHMRLRHPDEEPRIPWDEYLGLRFDPDSSAFELDHHERIYNSFGSIQGGGMGALLERGASYAAERECGGPARTVDLHFAYTAQARQGPFRVEAEALRGNGEGVLSRVSLLDLGQEGRVAAIGTALARPIDP